MRLVMVAVSAAALVAFLAVGLINLPSVAAASKPLGMVWLPITPIWTMPTRLPAPASIPMIPRHRQGGSLQAERRSQPDLPPFFKFPLALSRGTTKFRLGLTGARWASPPPGPPSFRYRRLWALCMERMRILFSAK